MKPHRFMLALWVPLVAWLLVLPAAQAENTSLVAESQPTGLTVALSSQLAPLTINQMHNWIVTVTSADGRPVEDATILVDGGMPAHNHGLATHPRITDYLGDGQYLLQGMRFHMNGEWVVVLRIEHSGRRHTAEFNLHL
jgi:hypothetical protein